LDDLLDVLLDVLLDESAGTGRHRSEWYGRILPPAFRWPIV